MHAYRVNYTDGARTWHKRSLWCYKLWHTLKWCKNLAFTCIYSAYRVWIRNRRWHGLPAWRGSRCQPLLWCVGCYFAKKNLTLFFSGKCTIVGRMVPRVSNPQIKKTTLRLELEHESCPSSRGLLTTSPRRVLCLWWIRLLYYSMILRHTAVRAAHFALLFCYKIYLNYNHGL